MIIGVPKEVKDQEYRVSMVPAGVKSLMDAGHRVLVQKNAGVGSGIPDEDYLDVGAEMPETIEEVYNASELIVKVKEPIDRECELLSEGQAIYTFLHLAPMDDLTQKLLDKDITAIAYETITDDSGGLPLLTPMSEVAGRMSTQTGAYYLEKDNGGEGVLLGGVPGVSPANVVIIGGGIVGLNAAKIAMGMGAQVTILEKSPSQMRYIDDIYSGRIHTVNSNYVTISETTSRADLVIGAVLIPGASAPKLVTREMIEDMKPGSVFVDVAIDQGGCAETSRPTTHTEPTYKVDGVIHYCVTNMPGAVPRTSTFALTNATFPLAKTLAQKGIKKALKEDANLRNGLNLYSGKVTCQAVAASQDREYVDPEKLI